MVTEMRGAVLFPQEGRPKDDPCSDQPEATQEIQPKPTDRIANLLLFSNSEQNQILSHPADIFAFPSPPRDY